jgi:Ricin-type beta-trefoil lectin domain-like
VPATGGTYTISNRNSGLRADVEGNATTAGAAVIQWTATNGANQRWQLVRLS